MSENTNISWCDSTFNPWIGCTKVGPGCDHCYAERVMDTRMHMVQWGPHGERKRTSVSNWKEPLRWEKQAAAFLAEHGRRRRVFCASLADVFDNAVPPAWRTDLFALIEATPSLDWLLLTKRVGNAADMIRDALWDLAHARNAENGERLVLPPNVRIIITVVNQAEFDRDIEKLVSLRCPNGLSMEPLLGPVDLSGNLPSQRMLRWYKPVLAMLDWVIAGGESGHGARPMHPDWVRDLRDQCAAAGVPFHFKQWGEWVPRGPESLGYPVVDDVPRIRLTDAGENGQDLGSEGGNDCWMNRAGKKAAGRLLDGIEHNGFPKA